MQIRGTRYFFGGTPVGGHFFRYYCTSVGEEGFFLSDVYSGSMLPHLNCGCVWCRYGDCWWCGYSWISSTGVCHCREGSEFLGFILGLIWLITDLVRVDGNEEEGSETMNGKA